MYKGWACVYIGNFSTLCSGRDSPTANEGGEDQDEAMPVPEDLSASTGLQHNNRTDKPLGESHHPKLGHNHKTTSYTHSCNTQSDITSTEAHF